MPYDPANIDPDTYDHLKAIARRIYNERSGSQSLQPTLLLHEAWERVNKSSNDFGDREHFMATAAMAMRHVLVDHARSKKRLKRGPDRVRATLTGLPDSNNSPISMLDFDRALEELKEASPRDAEVVLLRSVGGLTVPEVARVMSIGQSSVDRSWRRGRAFLSSRLWESGEK